MDSQEQVERDIEFGKALKRGPCKPFVGEDNLSEDDRYEYFRQRMWMAGISKQEMELRVSAGVRAKQRIIAKFRAPVRGNVHELKLVV